MNNIQMENLAQKARWHFKCRMLVLGCLLLAIVVTTEGQTMMCPEQCSCNLYFKPGVGPAIHVDCNNGGMNAIPVERLERKVYQLVISPPINKPNNLSIGPILTQPMPFSRLTLLTIANSNVPSIGQFAFWGLHNLISLNLTRNNLTSITAENFRGLVNLTYLTLDYNNIAEMPSEVFRHLISLQELSVKYNKISGLLPRLFRMLANLYKLDLSYNPIQELYPEVFQDIQNLRIFKCRGCRLSRINPQIYHFAPLIDELDLGENRFKYLNENEFINLKKLKKLQLDGNQVPVIVDNVFGQNRQIESLGLAHNRLALLAPGALKTLSKLKVLDLSNNKLDKLHLQTFASAVKTLRYIDFSGNNLPLHEIAILLETLPFLTHIGMSNLSLMDIPPNFFIHNHFLQYINLSKNRLTTFPLKTIQTTKVLKDLDISENKIEMLNEMDLSRLEAIPKINLSGNAWHCDQCSVGNMITYMNTSVLNHSIRFLTCNTPTRLQGVQLADLTPDMLDMCSLNYEAQISVIAGLVLVLVAIFAAMTIVVCIRRRRAAQYYTNEEKRRRRNRDHPEELLAQSENGNVATIHSPYQHAPNCS